MKIFKLFAVGMMLCALAGCNKEAPRIGIVNVVKVVNESDSGKAANAELNGLVKTRRDQLAVKANAIADDKKSLQAASSAAAKKSARAQLEKAEADYRQLLQASDAEVKKKAGQLRTEVLQKLQKVIDAMGQERKFQVILATANVVYFEKTMDVTDEVIKRFNETSGRR